MFLSNPAQKDLRQELAKKAHVPISCIRHFGVVEVVLFQGF